MKLKVAFGFLPYLLWKTWMKDGRAGESKMFIVRAGPDPALSVIKHEEVHIAFWYLITSVVLLLLATVAPLWLAFLLSLVFKPIVSDILGQSWKGFEESFAYARGALYKEDTQKYLTQIRHSTVLKGMYGDNFGDRVRSRTKWFGGITL